MYKLTSNIFKYKKIGDINPIVYYICRITHPKILKILESEDSLEQLLVIWNPSHELPLKGRYLYGLYSIANIKSIMLETEKSVITPQELYNIRLNLYQHVTTDIEYTVVQKILSTVWELNGFEIHDLIHI